MRAFVMSNLGPNSSPTSVNVGRYQTQREPSQEAHTVPVQAMSSELSPGPLSCSRGVKTRIDPSIRAAAAGPGEARPKKAALWVFSSVDSLRLKPRSHPTRRSSLLGEERSVVWTQCGCCFLGGWLLEVACCAELLLDLRPAPQKPPNFTGSHLGT